MNHPFVSIRLIALPPHRVAEREAIVAQLAEAARGLKTMSSSWVAPVIDSAVLNAGHIVWRLESTTEIAALRVQLDPAWTGSVQPLLEGLHVTTVGYRMTRSNIKPAGAGIWRALIFRLFPTASPDAAAALEAQTLLMPKYIPVIRSWALNPVAFTEGPKDFTYVWEQEFDELSGLAGEYMTHPIHWGLIDSWFDAECPNYIVDPMLIQVVGHIDQTIMS